MMGTGAAIRERGGFDVLRACERIVEEERTRTGRTGLPVGSVHVTTAGTLAFDAVIHCVASGDAHRSSPDIIRICAQKALRTAASLGASSVALPVFGSGHARVRFDQAVRALAEGVRGAPVGIEMIVVVVPERDRAAEAEQILRDVLGQEALS